VSFDLRQPYLKRWRCIAEAACEWVAEDKEKEMPVRLFSGFSNTPHPQAASARLPYLSALYWPDLRATRKPMT
jgi:hypothetical protein